MTCGENGALAFDTSGNTHEVAPESKTHIVDTVGAGDAFAAVVLLGLLRDWTLQRIMHRAQIFASRICEQRGATSAHLALYRDLMTQWQASEAQP